MKMLIAKAEKKGTFTGIQRKDGEYDICFAPYGEWNGEYICTVRDRETAEKLCKLYEQVHNAGVEELEKERAINAILGEIADKVLNDKEYQAIFEDYDELPPIGQRQRDGRGKMFIRSKLEAKLPEIEAIKGEAVTDEEIEKYITEIEEWYN